MGRSKIIIDWTRLDSYLELKATKKSCALLLEISEDTIERNIKSKYGLTFTEYAEKRMEPIKLKLIQKALSKALDGENVLLIFCLKNLCGWGDRFEEDKDEKQKTVTLNYKIE